MLRVAVTRIDPSLPLPGYATSGSAGLDLCCRADTTVAPRSLALIPSNVIVAVPVGYVFVVALRSGTPRRTGLISPHGIGIVDADYRGPEDEVQIQVFNPGDSPVTVRRGDRIAQGLFLPLPGIEWDERDPATESSRGGFGSTGI